MAADREAFLELIGHENTVEMDRLRDIAFYGVPPGIREKVWMLLIPALQVSTSPGAGGAAASLGSGKADGSAQQHQQHQQQHAQQGHTQQQQAQQHQHQQFALLDQHQNQELALEQQQRQRNHEQELQRQRMREQQPGARDATGTEQGASAHGDSSRTLRRESEFPTVSLGFDDSLTDFEIQRVLRTELARYQRRNAAFKTAKMQNKILNILHGYLHNASNAWHVHHAALVHVVAPFAFLFKKESEASYCFQLMMRALDAHFGPTNGRKTLGRFLMLFRSRLPELFTHFEEEDLEASQWASPWLQWLLCRELPFDCCLRLWDSYFSAPDGHGFDLHTFVCLAILESCQADLIELEHAELLSFLRHLPTLDMDRIIVQSQYLAHDFRSQR